MNDSMALSGCSLSRKLSPRKYESGNARDSRNRCLMSMRAAIHPMAKNSAGMGSSHQSSKSMEASRLRDVGGRRVFWISQRVLAPQAHHLPLQARRAHESGQKTRYCAAGKREQQQKDERRLPGEPVIEADGDQVGVLQRKQQQQEEDDDGDDPASDVHAADPMKRAALSRLTMPPGNESSSAFLEFLEIDALPQFLSGLEVRDVLFGHL